MTSRRRRPVEVLVLARRRPLACPRVVEPEPVVDVVAPAPLELVRRRRVVWGDLDAAELRHAVEGTFREARRP